MDAYVVITMTRQEADDLRTALLTGFQGVRHLPDSVSDLIGRLGECL